MLKIMNPAMSEACPTRAIVRRRFASALATIAAASLCRHVAADPVGCPDFEVVQPRERGGVLFATDFGFSVTNSDNAAAINRAIAECRRVGAGRLELAAGTYPCNGPEGVCIADCEDFILDGKGAVLVFRRKHTKDWNASAPDGAASGNGVNLFLDRCRRVRVENLTMDWDWERDPLGILAVCAARHIDETDGESWIDFELLSPTRHPLHPNPVPVQTIQPMRRTERGGVSGRLAAGGGRCYFGQQPGHFGCRNEWVSPTRLRLWPYMAQPDRPQDPGSMTRFSAQRNRDATAKFDVGEIYALSHRYYGMGGIYMLSGEHVTLRNVTVWSCFGTGLCIDGTQNHTLLDRLRIAPPSRQEAEAAGLGRVWPRSVTSTSDAIHVSRSGGFLKLLGCELSLHNDDSVNIHDSTTLARAEGPRTLRIVNNNGPDYFGAGPGTEVELRQEDYSATGWTGKIVSASDWTFTFDRDLPEQRGLFFVLFNRTYATGNILMRDCAIHDVPWGRSLILAPDVTIERCSFRNLPSAPMRFQTCYSYNVWCEGTGCTNVVVRNCTFENCAARNLVDGVSAQIYCGVRVPTSKGWAEKGIVPIRDAQLRAEVETRLARGPEADVVPAFRDVLSDILIEGNTFVNPRGATLYAEDASGVVFRGNVVAFEDNPPYELLPDAGKTVTSPPTGNETEVPPR